MDDRFDFDSEEIDVMVDSETVDALDFFSTVLARDYPDLTFEAYSPREWRLGWHITLPSHTEYSVKEVELAARKLQDRFFWKAGFLLPYTINRAAEPSESGNDEDEDA